MWNEARTDPALVAARIPARSSRAAASGTSTLTIAELPGAEPESGAEPIRQRDIVTLDLLDADLEEELRASVPAATHENQAGDVSRRRADEASRSGVP